MNCSGEYTCSPVITGTFTTTVYTCCHQGNTLHLLSLFAGRHDFICIFYAIRLIYSHKDCLTKQAAVTYLHGHTMHWAFFSHSTYVEMSQVFAIKKKKVCLTSCLDFKVLLIFMLWLTGTLKYKGVIVADSYAFLLQIHKTFINVTPF